MAILIGVGFVVLLEIAATAALLWAYFSLDEWHPKLKQSLNSYLLSLKEKRALLASIEEILVGARHSQAKSIGKWSMIAKTAVTLLEKLASAAKCA